MARWIDVRPRAYADLRDAAVYLDSRSPTAARRFIEAATATLEELASSPDIGVPRRIEHAPEGLRSFPVRGFRKYLVFYRVTADVIEVLRVLHGARDIDAELGR